MAFNGSGVFLRLYNWTQDAAAGIKIRADRMDAETNGIATGLSTCITKDGQTTITANLPMSTFNHTGVGDASQRDEYAAEGQVQDGVLNWAAAGGTADAITANYTIALTALVDGQLCYVRAGAANATTTPTFSPNGITARVIVKNGGQALAIGDIAGAGHELELRYLVASTRWELMNPAASALPASLTDLSTKWTPASASGAASLQFSEDTDNGTNKITFKAPATLAGDYDLVLPSAQGAANALMTNDGSGNLSWPLTPATTADIIAGTANKYVAADAAAPLFYGFSIYASSPTASGNVIAYDQEEYDDGGWHSTSVTNSRVIPTFAGRIFLLFDYKGTTVGNAAYNFEILKNGVQVACTNDISTATTPTRKNLSIIETCNGTTDYFETRYTTTGTAMSTGATGTRFQGYRIK
jgi:hypothetical protein